MRRELCEREECVLADCRMEWGNLITLNPLPPCALGFTTLSPKGSTTCTLPILLTYIPCSFLTQTNTTYRLNNALCPIDIQTPHFLQLHPWHSELFILIIIVFFLLLILFSCITLKTPHKKIHIKNTFLVDIKNMQFNRLVFH